MNEPTAENVEKIIALLLIARNLKLADLWSPVQDTFEPLLGPNKEDQVSDSRHVSRSSVQFRTGVPPFFSLALRHTVLLRSQCPACLHTAESLGGPLPLKLLVPNL